MFCFSFSLSAVAVQTQMTGTGILTTLALPQPSSLVVFHGLAVLERFGFSHFLRHFCLPSLVLLVQSLLSLILCISHLSYFLMNLLIFYILVLYGDTY